MSIEAALRQSLRDFYFNSWRLAPANLVWGVVLVLGIVAGPFSILGIGFFVLLALPTVGLYRMAALIARGEAVAFSDFVAATRRYGVAALGVAAAAAIFGVVLITNIFVGLAASNPVGWFVTSRPSMVSAPSPTDTSLSTRCKREPSSATSPSARSPSFRPRTSRALTSGR